MKPFRFKQHSVLPGFGLALGFTVFYLSLIVLIPLSATVLKTTALTWTNFWHTVTAPRALASYRLSFGASAISALINAVFGLLVAWVLVRYRFPGRRVVDALVDLPFALPTAVVAPVWARQSPGIKSPKSASRWSAVGGLRGGGQHGSGTGWAGRPACRAHGHHPDPSQTHGPRPRPLT